MGTIQLLDARTADQIAAGEVVERPASVVKELLENALDAGAAHVEVEVEGGGLTRISVIDDGAGMDAADAVLCFSRHATSKLRSADELLHIGTFGFRGEALAAISSVAKVRLRSRTAADDAAHEVRVEGGRVVHVGEAGAPRGTRIDVEELFFNTPARRKFLKTERTEAGHIEDTVSSAALSLPTIGFRVVVDGKPALDLPPALTDAARLERAVRCLGKHVRPHLFPFAASTELLALTGFIVAPLETRRDLAGVHLSVNARPVSDRGLVQAVRAAFRTLLEVGRQPIVALDIRIDPTLVDVNVHPRKSEVRFVDPRRVNGHVIALLSDFLASTPWLKSSEPPAIRPRIMVLSSSAGSSGPAGLQGGTSSSSWTAAGPSSAALVPSSAALVPSSAALVPSSASSTAASSTAASSTAAHDESLALSNNGAAPRALGNDGAAPSNSAIAQGPLGQDELIDAHRARIRAALARYDDARGPVFPMQRALVDDVTAGARPLSLLPVAGTGGAGSFSQLRVVGQVGATYLVLEAPEGMVVIDQHAAHERVVFERLRAQRTTSPSQPLLIPITIDLSALEMSALDDVEGRALLERHGLVVEPFGPRTAVVKAVPPGLDGKKAEVIARDALAELATSGGSGALDDRVDRVCARLACHAAVRAGDAMSLEAVRALLRDLDAIDLGAHCPHGRPVVRSVRYDELAKWFDR